LSRVSIETNNCFSDLLSRVSGEKIRRVDSYSNAFFPDQNQSGWSAIGIPDCHTQTFRIRGRIQ
jgi:hypothetical protein